MNNEEMAENLLGKICYVIDIFPSTVREIDIENFIKVEEYYLQEQELEKLAGKIVTILIKMMCYHKFEVFCERWYNSLEPWYLAELIRRTLKSNDGFLNLLCKEDNMLITVNGKTLHISVYNPPLRAIANLSMLSNAEGLFMRCAE